VTIRLIAGLGAVLRGVRLTAPSAHVAPPHVEELLHDLVDDDDPRLAETTTWASEERAVFRVGKEPGDVNPSKPAASG